MEKSKLLIPSSARNAWGQAPLETLGENNLNLFEFFLIIFWISLFLCLDFPDSFENPGNPMKKYLFLYCLDYVLLGRFADFTIYLDFSCLFHLFFCLIFIHL
jgi:hypothetical protein